MHAIKEAKSDLNVQADLILYAGHISACLAVLLKENFVVELDGANMPAQFSLRIFPVDSVPAPVTPLLARALDEIYDMLEHMESSMYVFTVQQQNLSNSEHILFTISR